MQDKSYLHRCFELAKLAGREARPNPRVGAVIVHNDRIIGEGYHKKYGGPHAEVNAVNSVREEDRQYLSESTMYVSLEPCCHFGITPPCTDLIIRNKIPRVCIAEIDPTQKVNSKGINIMQSHSIEVKIIPIEDNDIIEEFKVNQLKQRPFVQLKFAKSVDNFIGQKGEQVWLSNETSGIFTHKLRAHTDAILIGTNTALIDNPALTLRNYPGNQPLRIVLDRQNRIPESHTLLSDALPTLIFTEQKRTLSLPIKKQFEIDFSTENFVEDLLNKLFTMDIFHVMVEGGASLHKSFLSSGLWDEAVVINTPLLLNSGVKAPHLHGKIKDRFQLDGDEVLVIGNWHEEAKNKN
ncbi:MAG: bifunctional diaminohydroxyphosphoribosylaminopyrimidine deaminase/5-amino-6-(5-phosphoribosylamino)uracil reductase RibD [Bacteroidota bacterium]